MSIKLYGLLEVLSILSWIWTTNGIPMTQRSLAACEFDEGDVTMPPNTPYRRVRLLVREFNQGTSNMYTYGAKLVHHSVRTISTNRTAQYLVDDVRATFDGENICVLVKKLTILDQSGKNERRIYSCERKCFKVGEKITIDTKLEEGGVLKWNSVRLCCVWTTRVWLEISVEKPSFKCAICQGLTCDQQTEELIHCPAGEGCVSISFKARGNSSQGSLRLKGCTDHKLLYDRGCWDECRTIGVAYEMCIHCCYGDGCNKENFNRTTGSPSPAQETWKGARGVSGSEGGGVGGLVLVMLNIIGMLLMS
ncbi:uncharacterized protein LOC116610221 [Nematostella vectensis]|uniref:uncharacterized protein LOC116610221 n=1 Tax=Nematostella vectensis TaxID=45351 RepID=UPI0020772C9B|nr:uncharacterized protein LOC116610221 [Nematostella vectensis]